MREYLSSKYSSTQLFGRQYLQAELLISSSEARQLQFTVLGTNRDMEFNDFVKIVEYALGRENEAEVLSYQKRIA